MRQGILDGDAFFGMNVQHATEQVQSRAGCAGELARKGRCRGVRQLAHEAFGLFGSDKVEILFGEFSKFLGNDSQLINVIIARKVWLSKDEFRKDTSHTPHIDWFRVLIAGQHDFRRSVPTCHDVFGQHHGSIFGGGVVRHGMLIIIPMNATRESKITNFEIAIGIDQ